MLWAPLRNSRVFRPVIEQIGRRIAVGRLCETDNRPAFENARKGSREELETRVINFYVSMRNPAAHNKPVEWLNTRKNMNFGDSTPYIILWDIYC